MCGKATTVPSAAQQRESATGSAKRTSSGPAESARIAKTLDQHGSLSRRARAQQLAQDQAQIERAHVDRPVHPLDNCGIDNINWKSSQTRRPDIFPVAFDGVRNTC